MKLKKNSKMIHELCRLCCGQNIENIMIFSLHQNTYDIVDIIFQLTSLQVQSNDDLPKRICHECVDKLISYYLFRETIFKSQQRLLQTKIELTKKAEHVDQTSQLKELDPSESTHDGKNEYFHILNDITFIDVKEEDDNEENGDRPAVVTQITTQFSHPNSLTDRPQRNENKKKSKVDINITKKTKKKKNGQLNDGVAFNENKKQYICEKCNIVCMYPSRFLAHYRRSHLKQFERKICPYCPRAFTLSVTGTSNLGRHIRTSHQNQMTDKNKYPTIKCTDCNGVFCGPLEYYEHSKIHDAHSRERNDGYNLVCDNCDIDLETFDHFHQHMRDQHGITDKKDIRPVRCRWCGERCRNLLGLCTHIRIVHKFEGNGDDAIPSDMINKLARGRGSTFLCMVCGKVLRSQSSYTHHMAAHAGEKQFTCDLCDAKFTSGGSLITHKLVHSKERKQRCTVCGKTFKQLAHLKTHLKSHGIGIKEKFPCNICNKEFLFRGVLKEHMWVHKKGEARPHVCGHCGRGFVRRHKLNEHVNKEHNKA